MVITGNTFHISFTEKIVFQLIKHARVEDRFTDDTKRLCGTAYTGSDASALVSCGSMASRSIDSSSQNAITLQLRGRAAVRLPLSLVFED